jgi:transcriptional regulator with XRE-family HTH domain
LNETFCRALLQAGLTEEDIAARLGVDPKTVRRWIEGRALPYRRHRWALAALLGTAETELWPQLRSIQPRPQEVVAVYPHLGTVAQEVWLGLFASAEGNIDILDAGGLAVAGDREIVGILAERARIGVTVRICLADRGASESRAEPAMSAPRIDVGSALEQYAPLRGGDRVQIRLYQREQYSFIYRADGQLFVAQRAYGVSVVQVPVLHLRRADGGDMFATYAESFERTWAHARPVSRPNCPPGD